ncbi:MAG TPA: hypothetical protein VMG10_03550 [Gemmataceae bacterium]|nr:hypothetical protein [Gemmataceae bacterium]
MRSFRKPVLFLALVLAGAASADDQVKADDQAKTANELKKKAEATWDTITDSKPASHETKHFLVVAPEAMGKRLKDIGQLLEKHHDKAKEALKFEVKEEDKGEVLPGKVTVYLFAERNQFKSFVRRIEARRLLAEESVSFQADDDKLHVAVSPSSGRQGLPIEIRACEQVASLLLARRAGVKTPLPDWLMSGFGRATYYRVAPRDKAVVADRRLAIQLARKRSAEEIWNDKIAADEAAALQGSLVDYLAYGPGARAFSKLVTGYVPEENKERKTAWQAFDAANMKPEVVAQGWKRWVATAR